MDPEKDAKAARVKAEKKFNLHLVANPNASPEMAAAYLQMIDKVCDWVRDHEEAVSTKCWDESCKVAGSVRRQAGVVSSANNGAKAQKSDNVEEAQKTDNVEQAQKTDNVAIYPVPDKKRGRMMAEPTTYKVARMSGKPAPRKQLAEVAEVSRKEDDTESEMEDHINMHPDGTTYKVARITLNTAPSGKTADSGKTAPSDKTNVVQPTKRTKHAGQIPVGVAYRAPRKRLVKVAEVSRKEDDKTESEKEDPIKHLDFDSEQNQKGNRNLDYKHITGIAAGGGAAVNNEAENNEDGEATEAFDDEDSDCFIVDSE